MIKTVALPGLCWYRLEHLGEISSRSGDIATYIAIEKMEIGPRGNKSPIKIDVDENVAFVIAGFLHGEGEYLVHADDDDVRREGRALLEGAGFLVDAFSYEDAGVYA